MWTAERETGSGCVAAKGGPQRIAPPRTLPRAKKKKKPLDTRCQGLKKGPPTDGSGLVNRWRLAASGRVLRMVDRQNAR